MTKTVDSVAVRRLLLDCGFRDAPWPPRGERRWSLVGSVVEGGFEIVIACVGRGGEFHLNVPSEAAREWLREVLAQNGAGHVAVRVEAGPIPTERPWLAVAAGLSALALFAWSLI